MKNKKTFIIHLEENWFKNNDILDINTFHLQVIKVYKYNIWRKLLKFLGFKFKMFNCIRVKYI